MTEKILTSEDGRHQITEDGRILVVEDSAAPSVPSWCPPGGTAGVDYSAAFSAAYVTILPSGGKIDLLTLFKLYLGERGATRDCQLIVHLEMASTFIEKYIDNIIMKRKVIERFVHRQWPIVLRYNPTGDFLRFDLDGKPVAVGSGDYKWWVYVEDGLTWLSPSNNGCCAIFRECRFRQIEIEYEAGYDPIPPDLAHAMLLTAAGLENKQGTGKINIGGEGVIKKEVIQGVGSLEYDTSQSGGVNMTGAVGPIPFEAVEILNLYRRLYA